MGDHTKLLHYGEGGGIPLIIRMMARECFAIVVSWGRSGSVNGINATIYEKKGIPINQQRLIYGGRELLEGITRSDHQIQKDSC